MKNLLLLTLVMTLFIASYAQDNKPEANSFGMQYGVNFNGAVSQSVQLSGWLKHGIEIRGATSFAYTSSQTTTVIDNNTISVSNNRRIPTIQTNYGGSASLTATPSISVVKHFSATKNLDFFIGGAVSYGFTIPTANITNTTTITADSFYSYTSSSNKNPITFTWGLSILGGANFFFYKNMAIGADFGIGFGASNTNGNYVEQDIATNSGLNNTSTTNYNRSFANKITTNKYNLNLTGNAGLHLTYYVPCKKKITKISDPKI